MSEAAARNLIIAVCGPSRATPEQEELALTVGRLLVEAGATIVCGGLGGVMSAAARGASSVERGKVIGLLPGDDPNAANPYVDLAIPTGLGEMRNSLIVRASHGVIAIGGGHGTLSEIAFALRVGRPVVGLRTWQFRAPDETDEPPMILASTPQEAVASILDAVSIPMHQPEDRE
jgi:hypothetical protein